MRVFETGLEEKIQVIVDHPRIVWGQRSDLPVFDRCREEKILFLGVFRPVLALDLYPVEQVSHPQAA